MENEAQRDIIVKAIISQCDAELKDFSTGDTLRTVKVGRIAAENIFKAIRDAGYTFTRKD